MSAYPLVAVFSPSSSMAALSLGVHILSYAASNISPPGRRFSFQLSSGGAFQEYHHLKFLQQKKSEAANCYYEGVKSGYSEHEKVCHGNEDEYRLSGYNLFLKGYVGKPGLVMFYNFPPKDGDYIGVCQPRCNQKSVKWILGPGVLVTSFILPSFYLRSIISTFFEDSLLTDFFVLFFTEALFYCGVAVFLLLMDTLWRSNTPLSPKPTTNNAHSAYQVFSAVSLFISLIIPMITMGFSWPWIGPAASAALAPYLIGIFIQFAFEKYKKRKKSPSRAIIPIVFLVYRLHQLNRAAQLVTALLFTVRSAEMTPNNIAISNSLGILSAVLQFLGVVCIWALAGFLMRFFPASASPEL